MKDKNKKPSEAVLSPAKAAKSPAVTRPKQSDNVDFNAEEDTAQ